jgi:DNA-binding MarR family transcriptional regulator
MQRHEEVLVALRRIMRAVDLQSRRLVQRTGLTGPQHLVLQAIARGGQVSVGRVAREVSLSQGTVTSILDRLEAKALVRRVRSEADRRRVLVALTPLGEEAMEAAPPLLQEHFVRAFNDLADWEQHLILSSLQRVAAMLDAQDLEVAPVLESQTLQQ